MRKERGRVRKGKEKREEEEEREEGKRKGKSLPFLITLQIGKKSSRIKKEKE